MKAVVEKVSESPHSSINIEYNQVPYFNSTWHYHHEVELILIEKGRGNLFIGDRVMRFSDKTIAIIGPHLPHVWKNDDDYYEGKGLIAKSIVIKFKHDFLGEKFLHAPELSKINHLIEQSTYGLIFYGSTLNTLTKLFKKIPQLKGFEQLICFFNILNKMAQSKELNVCASSGYTLNYKDTESNRMDRIYHYILDNFDHPISLNKISGIANLSPTAFCRYFKTQTHKPFSLFLSEVRVGYACKLLIENKGKMSYVAEKSGFNNLANFYKQFKKITGTTPQKYKLEYVRNI